jgi:hypothetical protein
MVKMIFAYIKNIAFTLGVLLTLKTLLTHSPSARRRRCRNPKCHMTRKLLKPAQVAKVVNTERARQGKTPKLKVCPSWPLYQPSPQFENDVLLTVHGRSQNRHRNSVGTLHKSALISGQALLYIDISISPDEMFSQPEGGKNKKSTRLASLLSTWRGDLDHLYR